MDVIYDTLPPGAISEELAPVIQSLDLTRHCEELATDGWTVIEGMATAAFNDRLRRAIKEHSASGGANMLLHKDPVFAEAILQPKLRAMAEFSVGRGHLLSQVAASVRGKGAPQYRASCRPQLAAGAVPRPQHAANRVLGAGRLHRGRWCNAHYPW